MFILGQIEYWWSLPILLILTPARLPALPVHRITEFGVEEQTLDGWTGRTLATAKKEEGSLRGVKMAQGHAVTFWGRWLGWGQVLPVLSKMLTLVRVRHWPGWSV